jgi:biopolymer transport protein ExbD
MAEMTQVGGGKHEKGKTKKMSTRVDLTPMVDLAFLLITFFMLTTTFMKPQTMEISMPSKDKVTEEEQTKVKASRAITIIIGTNDSLFYYLGTRENNVDPQFLMTNYSPDGIRKILLEKNASAVLKIVDLKKKFESRQMKEEEYKKKVSEIKAAKDAPVVLIKSLDDATYNNLVDILDEMQICNIGRYAIVDITPFDTELLNKFRKGGK